jgi:hypothetical protein
MWTPRSTAGLLVAGLLLLAACGEESESAGDVPGSGGVPAGFTELAFDAAGVLETSVGEGVSPWIESMARSAEKGAPGESITIDYPLDESVFPPEFVPPTFLWHDPVERADLWLVSIEFPEAERLDVLVPSRPPTRGEPDPEAWGPTNEPYEGTAYQNSAKSWTPTRPVWEQIKRRSSEATASITFTGFSRSDPSTALSRGSVRILTSKDPVGAPIFYRDVPLMPDVGENGRIQPLSKKAIPLIAWRLREVSRPESKLVLKGMPSCGNCHSFSLDGTTLGMDVDGPDGDKGMYAIKAVEPRMVIGDEDVITWNSFPGRPKNHHTLGFLSRVSPDGSFVVSTVNEGLYVANFPSHEFLQVFFPTRGILAVHSRRDGSIRALPGADDPRYVHCNAVWTPDGQQLVFSRAEAFDPYEPGKPLATYPNDPNEPRIRYDLYRMPFRNGEGGQPVPIEGASDNGMSNTFPKVSPDGKWIVFVKCANGQLMRPDGRLWIVPFEGGEAREMRCNTRLMNSWHSFSPNGRWMVFSSKSNTPYTQAFLTHIDEEGNDSPAILIPNSTASNRAVNIPEFLNAPYESLDSIDVPVVDHHVHFLKGLRHMGEKRYAEAIASMEKAIEIEPTFSRAHAELGFAKTQLKRYDEAIAHFEKALETGSLHPLTYLNLAYAYLDTEHPDRALAVLRRGVEIVPEFPPMHHALGFAYRALNRPREAIEAYETTVRLDPRDRRAHAALQDLYRSLGNEARSVAHLRKVVELASRDASWKTRLAWRLATTPDDEVRDGPEALRLARAAVDATGGNRPEPLDALAAALAETGRFRDAALAAERALAKARKSRPDLVPALEARLALYRKERPFREAAELPR